MSIKSNMSPASKAQTDYLEKLIRDEARAAIDGSDFSKYQALRLIEGGPRAMRVLLTAMLTQGTVTDEFSDEKIESECRYLSGYGRANACATQYATIKRLFSWAESYDTVLAAKDAPAGTEGNFLILPWWTIAPTYNGAVEIILGKLSEQRSGKFNNYRAGELGPNHLRESQKKAFSMKALTEAQNGHDVLVVSAQLGLRHRGCSLRRARVVMNGNEFGLGAYEMGFILLTHPNRLEQYDDLYADCAGDEYRFEDSSEFLYAPYFNFCDMLEFSTRGVGRPREHSGAASAFVPASSPR